MTKNIWNILMRILAVIAAEALGVIGAGSVVGIETWKSCLLAGALGAATVIESLARGFIDDGKLSSQEINQAFSKVDKKSN